MALKKFLNNKPIFYKDIKLQNIKKAWSILEHKIKLPYIIHLVGTNGKGSTGRFIANGIYNSKNQNKPSVVHFSSPHILRVNERIWLNGDIVSDNVLDTAHTKLMSILNKTLCDSLSYFEYITMICFVISDKKKYLVLEAGLGGELDATNVVKNNLSVITPIDYDHQEFLGNSIKKITNTKLISCDNVMIIAKQKHKKVYKIAYKLSVKNKFSIVKFSNKYNLDNSPLAFYLNENLKTALNVLGYLNIKTNKKTLYDTSIFGRASKISDNIFLDVGHNPLGAKVICKFVKQNMSNTKINLIYNSYTNKNYAKVLKILKKVVKKVLYININDKQMCSMADIKKQCDKLNIEFDEFDVSKINKKSNQKYLVFGSFKVAEQFLRFYNAKQNV